MSIDARILKIREGVARLARHPLYDPTPAGATVAGVGVRIESGRTDRLLTVASARFRNKGRDGHEARPVEGEPPAGATGANGTSLKLKNRNGRTAPKTISEFRDHAH
jgi:trimethylamine:corrinoid methyltransferase-like protein